MNVTKARAGRQVQILGIFYILTEPTKERQGTRDTITILGVQGGCVQTVPWEEALWSNWQAGNGIWPWRCQNLHQPVTRTSATCWESNKYGWWYAGWWPGKRCPCCPWRPKRGGQEQHPTSLCWDPTTVQQAFGRLEWSAENYGKGSVFQFLSWLADDQHEGGWSNSDSEAHTWAGRIRAGIHFGVEKVRMDDCAHGQHALQILNDGLDAHSMRLLGVGRETSNLTHSKHNVGSSVVSQVK